MPANPLPAIHFLQQNKPVYSGKQALTDFASWLIAQVDFGKLFVLCDEHTEKLCLPLLIKMMPAEFKISKIVISAGESSKSIDVCTWLWKKLTEEQVGRADVLINLGGGVVSDIGGFVAATYLRGIRFVNIPTSLMAMADAALGGKTGLDLDHIKNRVGIVVFPECTVCFPGFLDTLTEYEWKSGAAEVFKHALIADAGLWNLLALEGCTPGFLEKQLLRIQQVKLNVVGQDPYETGKRKILNFGHTLGHAFESESFMRKEHSLSHGQAVVMGMIAEAMIAFHLQLLSKEQRDEIKVVLENYFGKQQFDLFSVPEVMKWLRYDKKNLNGSLKLSLLKGIGDCTWNVEVSETMIRDVLLETGVTDV